VRNGVKVRGKEQSEALAAVRFRRDELYEAILGVERALTAPAGDRTRSWATRLRRALGELHTALEHHIEVAEEDDGLFDEIMRREPRLANAIERLRADHGALMDSLAAANRRLGSVDDAAGVEEIREMVLGLLHSVFAHRHRGAELVYEAYNVDVSVGD
jgi:hypothetical protein